MFALILRVFSGKQAIVRYVFSIPVLLVQAWLSFGGGVPNSLQARVQISRIEFLGAVAFISLIISVFVGAIVGL